MTNLQRPDQDDAFISRDTTASRADTSSAPGVARQLVTSGLLSSDKSSDVFVPSSDISSSSFATDTVSITSTNVSGSGAVAERLVSLRSQIENGAYNVPSSTLADAMLRKGVFGT